MIPVDSCMLHPVGYDEQTRCLQVVFNTGQMYCYEDVPPEVFQDLLPTESKRAIYAGLHHRRVSLPPLPGACVTSDVNSYLDYSTLHGSPLSNLSEAINAAIRQMTEHPKEGARLWSRTNRFS